MILYEAVFKPVRNIFPCSHCVISQFVWAIMQKWHASYNMPLVWLIIGLKSGFQKSKVMSFCFLRFNKKN